MTVKRWENVCDSDEIQDQFEQGLVRADGEVCEVSREVFGGFPIFGGINRNSVRPRLLSELREGLADA